MRINNDFHRKAILVCIDDLCERRSELVSNLGNTEI